LEEEMIIHSVEKVIETELGIKPSEIPESRWKKCRLLFQYLD
jgi:hypothetical protein